MIFQINIYLKPALRTPFMVWIFFFALPISAQQFKLEKPLLKDFTDQDFPKMTHGDYFTLEGDEFIYQLLDGLPQFYSEQQFQELLHKLRPELKELYFFSYLIWNVSNGGFSNFYENDFGYMIPEIKKFYARIGEQQGWEILEKAEAWYQNRPKEEVWVDFTLEALDQAFYSSKATLDSKVESFIKANSNLYVRDENGAVFPQNFSGKVLSFDPLTQGIKEIQIIDNRKEGKMRITSTEGVLLREFNFENGIQVGVQRYFDFDENEDLDKEEVLSPDSEIKEVRSYHSNGQLSYQGNEAPDYKKVGLQTYWHENGQVKFSYLMDDQGNHTGPYFEYYPDGSKKVEVDRRESPPKYLNFLG
jgi:hypothetical protein